MAGCCGYNLKLSDILGRPLELYKFRKLAPFLGTKWICPKCEMEYFISWNRLDKFWQDPNDSKKEYLIENYFEYFNEFKDKFIYTDEFGNLRDTGFFYLKCIPVDILTKCDHKDDSTQLLDFSISVL